MFDIDLLDKKQLPIFLNKALHVQNTKEQFQQRYIDSIDHNSRLIEGLINSGKMDELKKNYPEVYTTFTQDKGIENIDKQIEKSKKKSWFSGWRLIVICVVTYIALSLLSKLLYPLVVLSDATAMIFGPIFRIVGFLAYIPLIVGFGYLLLAGIQYYTRKTNKFNNDDQKIKNEIVQANNNKKATTQSIIAANVRQTKPVKNAMQEWQNALNNLPGNDVICYNELPKDYHDSMLINKMLRYLDQHRAHNFEDLANLMVKEIREDNRQAQLLNSINNGFANLGNTINSSISQMEDHLAEIGERQIEIMENNSMAQMDMAEAILSQENAQTAFAADTNTQAHVAAYNTRH